MLSKLKEIFKNYKEIDAVYLFGSQVTGKLHPESDIDLGIINWYSDIPDILNQKGYIDDDLKNVWIRMICFKNTLVHDYIEVDRKIVFHTLQNNLYDFKRIEKALANFL